MSFGRNAGGVSEALLFSARLDGHAEALRVRLEGRAAAALVLVVARDSEERDRAREGLGELAPGVPAVLREDDTRAASAAVDAISQSMKRSEDGRCCEKVWHLVAVCVGQVSGDDDEVGRVLQDVLHCGDAVCRLRRAKMRSAQRGLKC